MNDGQEAASPDRSVLIQPPLRFTGIVASAGRVYGACLRQLVGTFAVLATVIFFVPALVFFDVGENLAIGIYILAGVVLPSAMLSVGFAVAATILSRYLEGDDHTVRASIRALKPLTKDVLFAALISGMLSLTIVVFLGPFGSLLIALFYGPPILIQVIAVRKLGIQPAWARTRELMEGHWGRILMALLTIALALGVLATTLLTLGGEMTADAPRAAQLVIFVVLELVIFGFGYSYLSAAGYVAYYDADARYEGPSDTAG